jgi:hypothetical protein
MTEPRVITLEDLVAINDLPEEIVEIPEWDGLAVRIRGMTKQQEMELRREAQAGGEWDPDAWELGLLTRCIVEPALSPDGAAVLRGKSAGAIDRILKRILALSGLGKGVVESAKKTFSAGSDSQVRVPPGDGPVDDGGDAAEDDERPGDGPLGGLVLGGGGDRETGTATVQEA